MIYYTTFSIYAILEIDGLYRVNLGGEVVYADSEAKAKEFIKNYEKKTKVI